MTIALDITPQRGIHVYAPGKYQACDDKVCFNPNRVPLTFSLKLKSLDRNPPGD